MKAVCLPYRPEDEEREQNFVCSKARWESFGYTVFAADSDTVVFSRAQAINKAVSEADANVVLICDSDVILETAEQADLACQIALAENVFVVAFTTLYVLDWAETRLIRAGADPSRQPVLETVRMIWSGCFAISRALFKKAGGFDPRFIGYGCEDLAFFVAATTVGGHPQRLEGNAYHLRHTAGTGATYENNLLYARYYAARDNLGEIMALVAER